MNIQKKPLKSLHYQNYIKAAYEDVLNLFFDAYDGHNLFLFYSKITPLSAHLFCMEFMMGTVRNDILIWYRARN